MSPEGVDNYSIALSTCGVFLWARLKYLPASQVTGSGNKSMSCRSGGSGGDCSS